MTDPPTPQLEIVLRDGEYEHTVPVSALCATLRLSPREFTTRARRLLRVVCGVEVEPLPVVEGEPTEGEPERSSTLTSTPKETFGTNGPTAGALPTDLDALAQHLADELGDPRSVQGLRRLAMAAPPEILREALRAAQAVPPHAIRKTRGAYFTAVVHALLRARGAPLEPPHSP